MCTESRLSKGKATYAASAAIFVVSYTINDCAGLAIESERSRTLKASST